MDKRKQKSQRSKTQFERGQTQVKRKRGRPPKVKTQQIEDKLENQRQGRQSRSRSREAEGKQNKEERVRFQADLIHELSSESESHDGYDVPLPPKTSPNNIFAGKLRDIFIKFFEELGQSKGLVFTNKQRQKLKNEEKRRASKTPYYVMVPWKDQSQWNEIAEKVKIGAIFEKNFYGGDLQQVSDIKEIFLGTSYIFSDEVTEQLYCFLLEVVKIILNQEDERQQRRRIKQLMLQLADGASEYKYLTFRFSQLFRIKLKKRDRIKVYRRLGLSLMKLLRHRFR